MYIELSEDLGVIGDLEGAHIATHGKSQMNILIFVLYLPQASHHWGCALALLPTEVPAPSLQVALASLPPSLLAPFLKSKQTFLPISSHNFSPKIVIKILYMPKYEIQEHILEKRRLPLRSF